METVPYHEFKFKRQIDLKGKAVQKVRKDIHAHTHIHTRTYTHIHTYIHTQVVHTEGTVAKL